jgi:DNA-binding transcriptional MerR regulator
VRIAELAAELGVSADWLRRLERAGQIPRSQRDVNGHRRYSTDDLQRLRAVLFGPLGTDPDDGTQAKAD